MKSEHTPLLFPFQVFAALEENIVTLSTMKASKFFLVFEKEISHWEKALSLISETIEMVLQVQRSWMYLENIFIGEKSSLLHLMLPASILHLL